MRGGRVGELGLRDEVQDFLFSTLWSARDSVLCVRPYRRGCRNSPLDNASVAQHFDMRGKLLDDQANHQAEDETPLAASLCRIWCIAWSAFVPSLLTHWLHPFALFRLLDNPDR